MLNEISLPAGFGLRIARAEDRVFMEQLFRSTREYLYLMNMPRQCVDILVTQQYQLQLASYQKQWPDATVLIIQLFAEEIGKIILNRNESAVHIVDVAFLPGWRGKGYGKTLLRAIQAVAAQQQVPVKLSVDRHNLLAKKLYLTLGFRVTGSSDTHDSMAWSHSAEPVSRT